MGGLPLLGSIPAGQIRGGFAGGGMDRAGALPVASGILLRVRGNSMTGDGFSTATLCSCVLTWTYFARGHRGRLRGR